MHQNRSPGNSHMQEGNGAKRKADEERPRNSKEIQTRVVLWTRRRVFQEVGRDESAQCHREVGGGKDSDAAQRPAPERPGSCRGE